VFAKIVVGIAIGAERALLHFIFFEQAGGAVSDLQPSLRLAACAASMLQAASDVPFPSQTG